MLQVTFQTYFNQSINCISKTRSVNLASRQIQIGLVALAALTLLVGCIVAAFFYSLSRTQKSFKDNERDKPVEIENFSTIDNGEVSVIKHPVNESFSEFKKDANQNPTKDSIPENFSTIQPEKNN